MLHKTRGIVINYIQYKETSIIVKIYTEHFGIQTYIENGVRSAKGKNKIALFQPLTILDLVVYHDVKKEINRISEIKCTQPFKSIPYNIIKSSLGIFLNEILNKTLKEHEGNEALFGFLIDTLNYLDFHENHIENFHLYFLLNFCFYLGFAPENGNEILDQLGLDFKDNGTLEKIINEIIDADFGAEIQINKSYRIAILDLILNFYALHIENFGEIKSIAILKEVLK